MSRIGLNETDYEGVILSIKIIIANPRGFCAGVDRAIAIVEKALELFGAPVYIRHEVVHNRHVVDELSNKGAVFVEQLAQIPDNSVVIFSAHGVSRQVRQQAAARKLRVYDATCPLVTKVHMEVVRYRQQGRQCILIGHQGHPEVEGILGQYAGDEKTQIHLVGSVAEINSLKIDASAPLAFITQTTLSVDDTAEIVAALRQRFPEIVGPKTEDICYATQNRQDAVKKLSRQCDLILVVGSPNSSNSARLREIPAKMGVSSYLIGDAGEIKRRWLQGRHCIGVTAGASAPEVLVQGVVARLREWTGGVPEEMDGKIERITFPMPKALNTPAVDKAQPGH